MENGNFVPGKADTDTLVVYFSSKGVQANGILKKGNTGVFAEKIAELTGADLFELVSADDIYPDNLVPLQGIAKKEIRENSRPAYIGDVPDFSRYKTVFIGGPAWYMSWPAINYTFLDQHDISNVTLVPFVTYVGSGMSGIDDKLRRLYPGIAQAKGLALKGADAQKMKAGVENEIKAWLKELGYGM